MFLTKSRFNIGISCPTKLFYESKSEQFDNSDAGNEFIKALAKGGIQIGEMAKLYYPNGIEINGKTKEDQLKQTNDALLKENVTLYEAAIIAGHKFIRVDVLVKNGDNIKIIEVKSASCVGNDESQFISSRGSLKKRKYLEDITFQYLVCLDAFPNFNIYPYLMMADKEVESSVDGLYQKFIIKKVNRRDVCLVLEETTKKDLGVQILTPIKLDKTIEYILNDRYYTEHLDFGGRDFKSIIIWFEDLLKGFESNQPCYFSSPFIKCRDCQYSSSEKSRSGFYNCMSVSNRWIDSDFDRPKVWDIWYSPKLSEFLKEGRWFMDEIYPLDIIGTKRERQVIQIEQTNNELGPYVDTEGLVSEFREFNWPLNFIDFETIGPVIPFFKGYKPYQGLCFQFSHHILHEDGRIEHKNEYLGMGQGENPSFKFVEELYKSLSQNSGSIFMYSTHENTYLNYMIKLLMKECPFEKEYTNELINFLKSITVPSKDIIPKWTPGKRKMIDMAVMVRSYYWHPLMKGSNSIKKVLPAIMQHSKFIQHKYSQPIYGKGNLINSLNFEDKSWVEFDEFGSVKDPYKTLPLFDQFLSIDVKNIDRVFESDSVADGGAAMTAWAYMQFGHMTDKERQVIANALKFYCELDTMAMVIIMEAWRDMVFNIKNP